MIRQPTPTELQQLVNLDFCDLTLGLHAHHDAWHLSDITTTTKLYVYCLSYTESLFPIEIAYQWGESIIIVDDTCQAGWSDEVKRLVNLNM